MSLYKENNLESQFKFDGLPNAILAQVGLSGVPFCLSFTAFTALLMESIVRLFILVSAN
jgi:hypothetical protein